MMKELVLENEPSFRQKEIARQYLDLLEAHIQDLKSGTSERALEIRDFAEKLHLHPVHLSNTIKEATGKSTCGHYEERLLRISKELLMDPNLSIGQIAQRLTYDPSNFTKFFKNYSGITPKQFRNQHS